MIKKNLFLMSFVLLFSYLSFADYGDVDLWLEKKYTYSEMDACTEHTFTVWQQYPSAMNLNNTYVAFYVNGIYAGSGSYVFDGQYQGGHYSFTYSSTEDYSISAHMYAEHTHWDVKNIISVKVNNLETTPLYNPDYSTFGFSSSGTTGTAPYTHTWEWSDCIGNHLVSDNQIWPASLTSDVTLTVTDAIGCVATWTGGQAVPQMVASATTSASLEFLKTKYTAHVSNGVGTFTYKWNWETSTHSYQVFNSIVNIHDGAANIVLTVTDANGCTDIWSPSGKTKLRIAGTSIEENKEISVYPNPATSTLNIEAPGNDVTVEIYNILSQKVLSSKNTKSIDINALESGNYMIKIISQGEITMKKFVKQ